MENMSLDINQNNTEESIDITVVDSLRDLFYNLEDKINYGKIINLDNINKEISLIIKNIEKYNSYMEEWYDDTFKKDTEKFNNIMNKFISDSITYKELSLVSNK
jgi:predicted RNA-binding protein with RPS1 domain